MSDEKTDNIKKVIEYIPAFTAFIIAFSCVKFWSYYQVFDLNIFRYTDLNDFVVEALTDLFRMSFATLFGLSIKAPYKFSSDTSIHPKGSQEWLFEKGKSFIKLIEILCYIILGILTILTLYKYFYGKWSMYSKRTMLSMCAASLAIISSQQIPLNYLKNNLKSFSRTTFIILWILPIYFILHILYAYNDALNVRYNHTTVNTFIVTSSNKVISTSSNYYIGETNSYLIFYDEKENKNDIYYKSDIKQLSLKRKN
ncbi:hypothetical protein [Mucilaginibacter defluvii]|uniref:Uncharacterized protein n=1 Tax=Mucilaginibacter defluvii TaxID=1196019 RepID=A0ABP9FML4_9SPHI